jgi:pyruvate kinase
VALAQKEMIERCNEVGKPVIVATQMLESMQQNPRPTRAEVSDVTNAVLDGADAVMLSGESANGNYPVESVKALWSIANEADKNVADLNDGRFNVPPTSNMSTIEALAYSTVRASQEMGASCIIAMTSTGKTAKYLSKFRPNVPVMAYLDNAKLGRQLIMHRGVHPLLFRRSDKGADTPDMAVKRALEFGFCKEGDKVLILQSLANENGKYDVVMRIRQVSSDGQSVDESDLEMEDYMHVFSGKRVMA